MPSGGEFKGGELAFRDREIAQAHQFASGRRPLWAR